MALAATVVAILAFMAMDDVQDRRDALQRAQVHAAADSIRARLESALVAPMSRTRGVVAQIVAHGDISVPDFDKVAKVLLSGHNNVRVIGLSHGTVIDRLYPLHGNEAALGADYRAQPLQWPTVERAISTRSPVLQGPVPLIQGGIGLISRAPIYLPGPDGEDRFFGIVSVVMDLPGVLADAGLDQPGLPVIFAIRGRDGLGADGEMVYGDKAVFSSNPIEADVTLPYGTWRLAAIPKDGWLDSHPIRLQIRSVGGAAIVAIAILAFVLAIRDSRRRLALVADAAYATRMQLFRQVMDRSNGMILVCDTATGKIIDANATASQWLGRDQSQLIEADAASIDPDFGKAYGESFDRRYRHNDGSTVIVNHSQQDIALDGATLTLILGHDVTERRQAEAALREEESKVRLLLNTLTDGVYGVDKEGRTIFINPAAARMYGYPAEDLLGQYIHDLVHHSYADGRAHPRAECPVFMAIAHGQPFHRKDDMLWRRDGTTFFAEIASAPMIVDETLIGAVVVIRDITDTRNATEELRRSNAELEQFAYVASHDLREPLRMISGYIRLIERRYTDSLDAEGREYVAFAKDGAVRLDRMICDLLDYSRIGRAECPKEPVDLNDAAREAIHNLSARIADVAGRVEIASALPVIRGHRGEIVRLLQNLIGNAVKYYAPGRPPVVEICASRQRGGYAVSIADNGIGIEPQDFDRIFGVFQRLHGRDAYEGTGIGLAVCKKIVERHGGTITVESDPGNGSVFRFVLPEA
jgi:PAS domain S-box-containing protein